MEIEREGETLFALNSNGTNEWTALVQGGKRDDGSRLTSSDVAKIAAEIQSMPKRIANLESLLEACSLRNERDVDHIAELEAQLKTANERLDIMMTINKGLFDS